MKKCNAKELCRQARGVFRKAKILAIKYRARAKESWKHTREQMTKGEQKGLIWGGIIFGIVLAVVLKFNLISTEAIQLIITFVLVSITAIYVKRTSDISKATREQADASMKMAEEMREQRYDTFRPIIDIVEPVMGPKEMATLAYNAKEGVFPKDWPCRMRNIGVGPAIELYSFIEDAKGKPRRWDFGAIPVAIGKEQMGYTDEVRLLLEQRGNCRALVVYYKDVYGNSLESIREVSVNKDKGAVNISPLRISPLPKKGDQE